MCVGVRRDDLMMCPPPGSKFFSRTSVDAGGGNKISLSFLFAQHPHLGVLADAGKWYRRGGKNLASCIACCLFGERGGGRGFPDVFFFWMAGSGIGWEELNALMLYTYLDTFNYLFVFRHLAFLSSSLSWPATSATAPFFSSIKIKHIESR